MMKEEQMTIRAMCEEFNVTPRTLRFYEAKELLQPIRKGQKRLFTRRDRARLKLILRGKRFGFALEDIRQLLDLYDIDDQHLAQIEHTCVMGRKRLDEMETQRRELATLISDLKDQLALGEQLIESRKAERSEQRPKI